MQEEYKQYVKNEKRRADVLEKDATRCMNNEADDAAKLNEYKSNDKEKDVKVVGESSRSLSFRKRMKGLSSHSHPLKE